MRLMKLQEDIDYELELHSMLAAQGSFNCQIDDDQLKIV